MNTRRDFLKKMTAASMVLPLISDNNLLNPKPYEGKQLRVALVGLGSYATRVANAMKTCQKAVLVGAVSGTPSKLDKWQAEYGISKENCYSYADFDKIISNPNIDLVYLTLPNSMHHPFTLRAAKAGKHVLTEKPMSVSVKEAEEMIAACQQAKVKLYVGYRLHFEPYTKELIRIRESGELGKIMFVNTANGFKALFSNTTGGENTANGYQALYYNNGNDNTATGDSALVAGTDRTPSQAAAGFRESHVRAIQAGTQDSCLQRHRFLGADFLHRFGMRFQPLANLPRQPLECG